MVKNMHILIVDDEFLARKRLRTLLNDCVRNTHGIPHKIREAANATKALEALDAPCGDKDTPIDLVLLDIHMPGLDGLDLAQRIRHMRLPPAIIFVTAHAEHALNAFDLDAVDYLTKPVRQTRLQQALAKVTPRSMPRSTLIPIATAATGSSKSKKKPVTQEMLSPAVLTVESRERIETIPLNHVLYCKAEQKYITVRTALRDYVLDDSLNDVEQRFQGHFVRIHRNTLVARDAIRALEKHCDTEEGNECWMVRLMGGKGELLPISRRQLSVVRAALAAP